MALVSDGRGNAKLVPSEKAACSIKKGDYVFLVNGRACSLLSDVYMSENDAQDLVTRIIFDLDNEGNGENIEPYYVKKLKPNQRTILNTLRNAKVDFDVLLDYYNSVAGEDDRWFVSRTILR